MDYNFISTTGCVAMWKKKKEKKTLKGQIVRSQCCLGDIVLYCTPRLTPVEFVWTRIWSISTFLLFLSSSFFVLLCDLTEMEVRYIWQLWTLWRQHRGDNAVFVCGCLPAYQTSLSGFFFLFFFPQTDKDCEDWHKGRWVCAIVFYCTPSAWVYQC